MLNLQLFYFVFAYALQRGAYVNLACSVILFWSDGNISSSVRYSYLVILPDGNANVFAASLLISYGSLLFLILSSIVMIRFYILCTVLFWKRERLSDARVASINKKEYGFAVHFLQRLRKALNSISDEWLNAICWSSRLLGIFIIK